MLFISFASTYMVNRERRQQQQQQQQQPAAAAGMMGVNTRGICSFCGKHFTNLQALGGHQTTHRKEIMVMRKEHESFMATTGYNNIGNSSEEVLKDHQHDQEVEPELQQLLLWQPQEKTIEILTPNEAFWEPYRRTGIAPCVLDFMGIGNPEMKDEGFGKNNNGEVVDYPLGLKLTQ